MQGIASSRIEEITRIQLAVTEGIPSTSQPLMQLKTVIFAKLKTVTSHGHCSKLLHTFREEQPLN